MFALKTWMIKINYNFPKNNIQRLSECSAIDDMKHIYECEIYTEIKEQKYLLY